MTTVSVIVPCLNEANSVTGMLEGIYRQSFPREELEVVIADGLSTDGTRQKIAGFQLLYPDLQMILLDNPARTIPAGLNTAISGSHGEFIIRLDAHSIPGPDYIQRCVEALRQGKGESVGGVWQVRPGANTWIARCIAQAGSHPLGVGDARYRYATSPAYVETVPFGAFKRELIARIGPFDETLLANEDYEFNTRILKSGGKIWMDPAIHSEYFARPTFRSLASQYWRYGRWKAQMLRRYPETVRLRQAVPPLFVLVILVLTVLSWVQPVFGKLLLGLLVVYIGILILTSAVIALQKRYLPFIIGVPVAVALMHLCWGSGLLWSMIRPPAVSAT